MIDTYLCNIHNAGDVFAWNSHTDSTKDQVKRLLLNIKCCMTYEFALHYAEFPCVEYISSMNHTSKKKTFTCINISKQDRPPAWPQEAYRPRSPHFWTLTGGGADLDLELDQGGPQTLTWTGPPPKNLTWTLTWGGRPRTLTRGGPQTLTLTRGSPPLWTDTQSKKITFPSYSVCGR